MIACFNTCRVLLFLCLLCFLSLGIRVCSDPLLYDCPNTTTYTPNSAYQANLKILFSALSSNATGINGFYNFTAGGNPPDIAYGLFLCRGDVSAADCQDCVINASKEIVKLCPKEKVAIAWYDYCLLRYSNKSIFSFADQSIGDSLPNNTQGVTDPDGFTHVLGETMDDIANRAAEGQSGKKFATKEANFKALQVFSLAQCTPDISKDGCNSCLRDAIASLPSCCYGKRGARVLFPSCYVRYELFQFYRIVPSPPVPKPALHPPLPPSPGSSPGNGRISLKAIIAIIVPIVVAVLLFFTCFCFLSRKRTKKYNDIKDEAGNETTTVQSLQYDLATIEAATRKFSNENKIGKGGFGDVYKGVLPNGQEIAVKRLSSSSGQGSEEFKNEVVLLAKLEHRNLVRLLGFCLEGEEKILVYEFVPNRSLDYFLFGKQQKLDWPTRYKITRGIARGILYLHEDSQLRIIHRDLKASNILLDGDMNPKISDFGMARIFDVDQTQGNTRRVVGTFGYMSPEYAMHGHFSVKSDVFSFGVLVLEIISGKKNNSFYHSDCADLLSYAWKLWRDGTPLVLVDSTIGDSYLKNEVIRCIHIGLLCVQDDQDARPSMATSVLMLNSYSVSLPVPRQPAFFARSGTGSKTRKGLESDQSTSKSIAWSVNEASISELYPR